MRLYVTIEFNSHNGEKGGTGRRWGRGVGGGGRGRLYTYRYTVTTRMSSALRWAAMRATPAHMDTDTQVGYIKGRKMDTEVSK